jgi:Clp amino terminal domain, pathogenicity island component
MIGRRRWPGVVPLLTEEARAIPIGGFEHARRLGLPYVGCEHWLIALAGAGHPAGAALREHGVTKQTALGPAPSSRHAMTRRSASSSSR